MASDISKLSVVLTSNSSGFAGGLKGGEVALKSMGATAKNVGGILSGFTGLLGTVGLGFSLWQGFAKAGEAEQAVATLEAVVRSTGQAAGFTSEELQTMAERMEGVTTFSKSAVVSAEAVLATFTNIRGDEFKQAMGAAANLSTVLKQDLKSSVIQIGKALNDPAKGFIALKRAGVSFTQSQIEQIKALQATGDILGAQKIILGELEHEFGGAAEAAGGTFAAQIDRAKASVGKIAKEIGEGMLPALSGMANLLKKGADWAKSHKDELKALGKGILTVIGVIAAYKTVMFAITAAQKVWNAIQAITLALQGPKGWLTLAGAVAVGAVAYGLVNAAQTQASEGMKDANVHMAAAREQMDGLMEGGEGAADAIAETAKSSKDAAKEAAQLEKSLADTAQRMEEEIILFGLSHNQQEAYRLTLRGVTGDQADYIQTMADQLDMLDAQKKAYDELSQAAQKYRDEIKTPGEKVAEEVEKIRKAEKANLLSAAEAAKAIDKVTGDFAKSRERKDPKKLGLAAGSTTDKTAALERRFTAGFPADQTDANRKMLLAQERAARAGEQTAKNTKKLVDTAPEVVTIGV